jgi:hypothetical protein
MYRFIESGPVTRRGDASPHGERARAMVPT